MTSASAKLRRVLPLLCGTLLLTPVASTASAGEPAETVVAPRAVAAISTAPVVVPMVFPVIGSVSYSDTFLACRSGCARQHLGQDLMSPRMRPLVAVFTGTVHSVRRETAPGGGNYLTLRGDNGWSANYLHVNNDTPGTDDGRGTASYAFAPGIREGLRVVQGQLLGWSGDSGNAEGTAPHTHFELRKGDPWSGVVFNAKPSLDRAWRLARPQTAGPHPDGMLVRDARYGPAWLLEDGRRRLISKGTIALNGYRLTDVVPVQAAEIAMYERGPDAPMRDGLVVRGPDGTLWVVADGARIRVPEESLAAIGVAADRIRVADAEAIARTPLAADQTLPEPVRPGALLRVDGSSALWLVQDGELRRVPDIPTLNSWGIAHQDAWTVPADLLEPPVDPTPDPEPSESADPAPTQEPSGNSVVLGVLDAIPTALPTPTVSRTPGTGGAESTPVIGSALLPRDGSLLREPTGVTWLVDGGERRLIPSGAVLHAYAMGAVTKRPAYAETLARIPQGPAFP